MKLLRRKFLHLTDRKRPSMDVQVGAFATLEAIAGESAPENVSQESRHDVGGHGILIASRATAAECVGRSC
jgi:hypothetical protein